MEKVIPDDWRLRLGIKPRDPRFAIEKFDGGWQLIDYAYANTLAVDTVGEAREVREFAREYVRRHGDIDLNSFPYDLDSELRYDDLATCVAWWDEHPSPVASAS